MEGEKFPENPNPIDISTELSNIAAATLNDEINQQESGKTPSEYEEEKGRRRIKRLPKQIKPETDLSESEKIWYWKLIPQNERSSVEVLTMFKNITNSPVIKQIREYKFSQPEKDLHKTLVKVLNDLEKLHYLSANNLSIEDIQKFVKNDDLEEIKKTVSADIDCIEIKIENLINNVNSFDEKEILEKEILFQVSRQALVDKLNELLKILNSLFETTRLF